MLPPPSEAQRRRSIVKTKSNAESEPDVMSDEDKRIKKSHLKVQICLNGRGMSVRYRTQRSFSASLSAAFRSESIVLGVDSLNLVAIACKFHQRLTIDDRYRTAFVRNVAKLLKSDRR